MAAMPDRGTVRVLAAGLSAALLLSSCALLRPSPTSPGDGRRGGSLAALDRYGAALFKMDEGRYNDAETDLAAAIRSSADNPSFLYSELADCQRLQGKAASAFTNYRKSLELEQSRVSTRFRLADLYFAMNDITNAAKTLESILAVDPRSTEALSDLASLYHQSGDRDRAVAYYRRLLETDPSNLQAAANLLDIFVSEQRYGECLTAWAGLPEILRSDFYILMQKAYCQKQMGAYRDCLVTLGEARATAGETDDLYYRETAEVLFFMADRRACLAALDSLQASAPDRFKPVHLAMRSTLLSTNLGEALRHYDAALSVSRFDLLPLYGKAMALAGLSRTAEASDQFILAGRTAFSGGNVFLATNCLSRARNLSPSSVKPRILLAAVYDEAGWTNAALAAIDDALRLQPTSATLMQFKSDLLEKAGRKADAYRTLRTAIGLGATNTDALLKAGYLAADTGNPAESVDWFTRAVRHRPGDPALLTVVGLSLLNAENPDAALENFQKAARLDPDVPKVRYYMAVCYEKKGLIPEAVTNLRMQISSDTNDADSWNFLGYLFADRAIRLDEAVDCIKHALSLEPENPFFLDSLGWAYFRQKKYPEAEKILEAAVARLEQRKISEPDIYEHLGDVYFAHDETPRAVTMWQKSLDMDPSNDGLKKKIKDSETRKIQK